MEPRPVYYYQPFRVETGLNGATATGPLLPRRGPRRRCQPAHGPMAAVSSRAATRKLSARTAVQATSFGSSAPVGSHVQLRPASRARLPLRLAPDVNVRVATEAVGGRKIARNPHRFRTPCCAPTVRFNSRPRAASFTQRAGLHRGHPSRESCGMVSHGAFVRHPPRMRVYFRNYYSAIKSIKTNQQKS